MWSSAVKLNCMNTYNGFTIKEAFSFPQEFFNRASSTVASVVEDFKKMEDAFKAVCALFGENYRDTEPDELFKILADFVENFKVFLYLVNVVHH